MARPTEEHNPVPVVDGTLRKQQIKEEEEEINNSKKNSSFSGGKEKGGVVLVKGESSNTSNCQNQGEREMASIHRSGSRPQLDLSKAAIQGNSEEKDPTILLPNQSDDISHLALDIGGINFTNSALSFSFFLFS